MRSRTTTLFSLSLVPVFVCAVSTAAGEVDYERHVKPVLRARCFACHGALKQESNLRLDTAESMRRGGDGGPVIVPGAAAGSELIARVSADDESFRMPPEGQRLSAEDIGKLKRWIDGGALAPADERPEDDPRAHWSFQPPVRTPIADADSSTWAQGAIDALLAALHRDRGLTPVGQAEKSLLLRRLSIDLVGFAPARSELQAFLADERPDAWERKVDELLASPAYGERWGRHWMDVWRYTDWYGLGEQLRYSQKHIWHWRDWIIESLNEDKGYDQMLREMLAADELAPSDPQALRATGFLARNYYLFNRTTWLDATIEHTSKAFLGLTLNCAKCHDHKYDPLSQHDYYAMRAIFEPHQVRLDSLPGQVDLEKDGIPRIFDAHPDAPTYIHVRGNEKEPDTQRVIAAGAPAVFAFAPFETTNIDLPEGAYAPSLRSFVLDDHLSIVEQEQARAQAALASAEQALQAAASQGAASGLPASDELTVRGLELELSKSRLAVAIAHARAVETAYAADAAKYRARPADELDPLVAAAARATAEYHVASAAVGVVQTQLAVAKAADELTRQKAERDLLTLEERLANVRRTLESPGTSYIPVRASLKALEGPDETEESRHSPYPRTSTGRRTALARWITDRRNPLTARVAVNHIWMRHFGRPLVDPVNDFGRRASAPPLQSVLDWLAVEFMDNGWSMKHVHRLIVTSQAYRLASGIANPDARTLELDPANHYVWRREPVRMESQVIRDSLLQLAGQLDRRLYGPTVSPNSSERRRSLYFTHSADEENRFISMFDNADILRCYRRSESIVPQQALALANSKLSLEMAQSIAESLEPAVASGGVASATARESFIAAAFQTILARDPTVEELAECQQAMAAASAIEAAGSAPELRARQVVVRALINHNDFVTIR